MVTALGCFGGDFNIDNGFLLSFSYKLSDLLSDKFSGLCMEPRKTRPEVPMRAGATPRTFWAVEIQKSVVAPAQFGDFFCVTFLFLVSLISLFSRDLCGSQGEEDGEDEAEARNSYLLHLLRPNSHRAQRRKFLVGLERPTVHFWARNRVQKWGRSSPTRCHSAAILHILSCATLSCLGICSFARVNARVTDRVNRLFCAPFTFTRCK